MPVRLTLEAVQDVEPTLTCSCSEVVMKSRGTDEEVVRAKVVILKGNQAYAVCKRCSSEVPLPLERRAEKAKPAPSSSGPPLLLHK